MYTSEPKLTEIVDIKSPVYVKVCSKLSTGNNTPSLAMTQFTDFAGKGLLELTTEPPNFKLTPLRIPLRIEITDHAPVVSVAAESFIPPILFVDIVMSPESMDVDWRLPHSGSEVNNYF